MHDWLEGITMNKFQLAVIMFLFSTSMLFPQLVDLDGYYFEIQPIAHRAGFSARFQLTFDVVNKGIENLKIEPADSSTIEIESFYTETNLWNLRSMRFLKDSSNVKWILEYRVVRNPIISHQYATYFADSLLVLNFPPAKVTKHISN